MKSFTNFIVEHKRAYYDDAVDDAIPVQWDKSDYKKEGVYIRDLEDEHINPYAHVSYDARANYDYRGKNYDRGDWPPRKPKSQVISDKEAHQRMQEAKARIIITGSKDEVGKYVDDPDPSIRELVARRGFRDHLDKLINDKHALLVRSAVAKRGFKEHLLKLADDPHPEVKSIARWRLEHPED